MRHSAGDHNEIWASIKHEVDDYKNPKLVADYIKKEYPNIPIGYWKDFTKILIDEYGKKLIKYLQ